jgi:hypothetical protein
VLMVESREDRRVRRLTYRSASSFLGTLLPGHCF